MNSPRIVFAVTIVLSTSIIDCCIFCTVYVNTSFLIISVCADFYVISNSKCVVFVRATRSIACIPNCINSKNHIVADTYLA